MAIEVRAARRDDRTFIFELGEATANSSFSNLRPPPLEDPGSSFRYFAEQLLAFSQTVSFIAEQDGKPAGFLIMLTDMHDEVTRGEQGFVAFVAVEKKARRRGVARRLLKAAEDEARRRSLPHLSLMVTASNHHARSLYAREGFVDERIQMTKPLRRAAS